MNEADERVFLDAMRRRTGMSHREISEALREQRERVERFAAIAADVHAIGGTPSSLPIGGAFSYAGRFLVYFNRHLDAPRVWCIATPGRTLEVQVATVDIRVPVTTRYERQLPQPNHDGPPSAWFEGTGHVAIDMDGTAVISPVPTGHQSPG